MGPLPGVLVEYLAIGSSSVLWILLLLLAFDQYPQQASSSLVLLLLPVVYVLGMVGDFFGQAWVDDNEDEIKLKVMNEISLKRGITFDPKVDIDIELAAYLPRVAEELTMRSSRDRIARGVLVNVPIVGVVLGLWLGTLVWKSTLKSLSARFVIIGVIVIVVTGLTIWLTGAVHRMWKRFQRHSYKYQFEAYATLQKLRGEGLSL